MCLRLPSPQASPQDGEACVQKVPLGHPGEGPDLRGEGPFKMRGSASPMGASGGCPGALGAELSVG